ncbi:presequence protease, mitochondrial-like [Prorops nasuta]|uniref:presequence protease, mitochondrial-like n=1 Tax=Prorops nasuta TaxID=863751 RepID=UPI0034CFABC4
MLRSLKLRKALTKVNQKPYLRCQDFHVSINIQQLSANIKTPTINNKLDKFQKNEVIEGFVVNEVAEVEDMNLTAIKLTHINTGAQYLHLSRDDSNNVFSINFRTTPMDSTGLPHILEHTTLCGSEKYPCRDPFFKMLRRSLATFMNAMTGPDYTLYPFSTQNFKDFQNLQSVYLDSVFKPNLREMDFRQEGWRLEHSEVADKSSPIIFKGVVFNEMKGVFNQNSAIFGEKLLNSLLPSHTYSVISGGDPLVIPNLQYKDLVDFHANYYHPSNSRFFSYGNFPLEEHLKLINDRYLNSCSRVDISQTEVPPEKRWTKSRKEHIYCSFDPMIADPKRQGSIAIAQLCNDITDVQETFEIYVLSQLLLKGPNSAFYKTLVDSNIGSGFGPITGFESQCKDTMFVVSLQGVKPEDFERVEEIYNETVDDVIDKGFEKERIDAILHSIELSIKHQSSNFGLNLLFNLTPLWNHNGDLVESMRINRAVKNLIYKLKESPDYFEKLVRIYLKDNCHRLTLTMSPKENYHEEKQLAEDNLLEAKLNGLSKEEREKIFEDGMRLLTEQQKQDDASVLPTLKIEDLKADVERYELTDTCVSGVPVQLSVQPTNGICYYRGILDTKHLSSDSKKLLPIFNSVLAKMGTKNYDYRSFDQLIESKTGGLSICNHVAESKDGNSEYKEGIFIESFALDRNVEDMWKIWVELFNNARLTDLRRFETLVKMEAARVVDGIAGSGHMYAMSTAASLVSPITRFKESLSGMEFVNRLKSIARRKDLSTLLEQMQQISQLVLNRNLLRSAINFSSDNKDDILKSLDSFYGSLEEVDNASCGSKQEGSSSTDVTTQNAIHHVLPYTVNYTSKAIATVPLMHPDYAALRVLSKLVTSMYLHPEIREKGGAYGGGAKLTTEGVFAFYSYRDPNSTRTLDIFDKTHEFLAHYSFPQVDIDEAKLGIFQQVDAPVAPGNRGLSKFTLGLTYDDIQLHRERLRAVTKEQLIDVAERYLKDEQQQQGSRLIGRCLIGPKNADILTRKAENWKIVEQREEEAS